MNQLYYLPEPVSITGSDIIIIGLSKDGSPYGIRGEQFIGDEVMDLEGAFSLVPFFTRRAESGEEVPEVESVMASTMAAILRGEKLYGKNFFRNGAR